MLRKVVLPVVLLALMLTVVVGSIGGIIGPLPGGKVAMAADGDAEKEKPKKEPVPDSIRAELADHWAADDIITLIEDGILMGFPDGTFRPENNTTRFELAKMLAMLTDLDPVDIRGAYDPLRGIADADTIPPWARPYVAAVVGDGLMAGTGDGFAGTQLVTRGQVATIVARLFPYASYRPLSGFKDSSEIPVWAQDGFKKALALGIFTGYPDQTLRSGQTITRAELAKILVMIGDQL